MTIYFDHNATSPIDPRVVEAMLPYFTKYLGNPSSLHRYGRFVRTAIESARAQVAQLVNAHPEQVFFTAGGTEANNWALKGIMQLHPGTLLISNIEHSSILQTAHALQTMGTKINFIPADKSSLILPNQLAELITKDTKLISIMLANNETGAVQDIAALSAIAQQHGIIFHTDAVQAAGKIAVDFMQLNVQLMSLASHKLAGPQGVGALIIDRATNIAPLIDGGGQEAGLRSGTHNVAGIVGFGKAAELAHLELADRQKKMRELQQHLEQGLEQMNGIQILAKSAPRLSNTTFFSMQGIDGDALLMNLDQAGFAVSSGSACSERRASHVALALGLTEEAAENVIRVSFSARNTQQEVDQFLLELNNQLK